jgi:L-alanine-DL-glutamate epimerase-like enolase superfamily enzyme
MRIQSIEAIPLHMQLHPEVAPHLYRSSHRGQITLYRVSLADGSVGYGEDLGNTGPVNAFVGRDAVAGLREIPHSGVQMACYDAVGKARAAAMGFTVYKFKCRPWWDPFEQIAAAEAVAPPGFEIWADFNGHLREVRQALPILQGLSEFKVIGGFESPIPQRDAAGYAELRAKIDKPIAAHYGSGCCHVRTDPAYDPGTPGLRQVSERLCDAFVLGSGDVETLKQQTSVAAEAQRPFWIQAVGGALRAVWTFHFASTCKTGTLSHLSTHNVWTEDVIEPLQPVAGWVDVPVGPGLGVEILESTIERLRSAPPIPWPRRITTVVYADGTRWHFGQETLRHESFYFGSFPGFAPGVRTEVWEDDGTATFGALFERCEKEPVAG